MAVLHHASPPVREFARDERTPTTLLSTTEHQELAALREKHGPIVGVPPWRELLELQRRELRRLREDLYRVDQALGEALTDPFALGLKAAFGHSAELADARGCSEVAAELRGWAKDPTR